MRGSRGRVAGLGLPRLVLPLTRLRPLTRLGPLALLARVLVTRRGLPFRPGLLFPRVLSHALDRKPDPPAAYLCLAFWAP